MSIIKISVILFLVALFCIKQAVAQEDCGLSTVDIHNQDSIKPVQDCIKEVLDEMDKTVDTHGVLLDKFKQKAQGILNDKAICEQYESYYKNATLNNKQAFESLVKSCYGLLTDREKKLADFSNQFKNMKKEYIEMKSTIFVLESKYNLLRSQIDFLR
jgi:hypothetical protein